MDLSLYSGSRMNPSKKRLAFSSLPIVLFIVVLFILQPACETEPAELAENNLKSIPDAQSDSLNRVDPDSLSRLAEAYALGSSHDSALYLHKAALAIREMQQVQDVQLVQSYNTVAGL